MGLCGPELVGRHLVLHEHGAGSVLRLEGAVQRVTAISV